ncbi:MAG TPA: hypothetical protein VKU02_12650 [Gemmataceae bacterium]|nr:hypothetical protein [Gemmataceae bacterium]
MWKRSRGPLVLAFATLAFFSGRKAEAAVVRFHYVPTDAAASTTMKPAGGGVAERIRWFGAVREPYSNSLRPTHVVTFRHPYTGRNVAVPLALPEGTPTLLHGPDRIIFNYGSYTVGAYFFPDGSVDVVYNSGLLRDL